MYTDRLNMYDMHDRLLRPCEQAGPISIMWQAVNLVLELGVLQARMSHV